MKEPVRVQVQPQVEFRNFLQDSQEHSHQLCSSSSTEDMKAQGT